MLRDSGFRRTMVARLVMTILCLGCSQAAAVALRGGHGLSPFNKVSEQAQVLPTERITLEVSENDAGLSGGALAGIIVGSIVGGLILIGLLGPIICCLCKRRKISSNQEKPGTTSETKTSSSSAWRFFPKKHVAPKGQFKAPVPPIFGSDKQDPDEISDTSFVLPELGGPNPHNKFDGMEWVDIKGLDDDTLQDISTDLRKYQQRR